MSRPLEQSSRGAQLPSTLWAWYGLLALTLVSFMYNLSRQVIILVTEPLKQDLGLSDTQIGALNGFALSLVAALAVVPLGWLTDRVDRRVLLAVCVGFWFIGTAGFGLAESFGALFGFAMGIAMLEAVLGPITYSIIPDLFPRERWITVNYVFYVLNVLGVSIGLAAGGAVMAAAEAGPGALPESITTLANWRIALQLVAAAAPVAVFLILLVPLRRRSVGAVAEAKRTPVLAYFRAHARALTGVFFGFGIIYSANGILMVWLPPALTRVFGIAPEEVGITLGSILTVSALAGVALSASWVHWLRPRRGDVAPMLVAQASTLLACVATAGLVLASTPFWVYAAAALKTVFVTSCLSLSPAILQFIAPSHMRGRVIALGGLVSIVFMTLSPLLVGIVSDNFFPRSSELLMAIGVVSVPCFLAGLLLLRFGAARLSEVFAAARD